MDFERVGLKILNFSFQHLKDKIFSDFLRYFASIYLFGNMLEKIIEMSEMGCFIAIALLLSYTLHIHTCIHCTHILKHTYTKIKGTPSFILFIYVYNFHSTHETCFISIHHTQYLLYCSVGVWEWGSKSAHL